MRLNDFDNPASRPTQKPVDEVFQTTMKDSFKLADMMGYSKHFLMLEAIMEAELGSTRPGPVLIKAKHDKNWIAYFDKANPRYMQVHDVRLDRDALHRWAIYGVNEKQMPIRTLYDLRPGREYSDTFEGIRELAFGEVIPLVKAGVIKGEGGAPITSLDGLMRIADEPWRNLFTQKTREIAANGISLAQIEKQIFAEPSASSAQRRT